MRLRWLVIAAMASGWGASLAGQQSTEIDSVAVRGLMGELTAAVRADADTTPLLRGLGARIVGVQARWTDVDIARLTALRVRDDLGSGLQAIITVQMQRQDADGAVVTAHLAADTAARSQVFGNLARMLAQVGHADAAVALLDELPDAARIAGLVTGAGRIAVGNRIRAQRLLHAARVRLPPGVPIHVLATLVEAQASVGATDEALSVLNEPRSAYDRTQLATRLMVDWARSQPTPRRQAVALLFTIECLLGPLP